MLRASTNEATLPLFAAPGKARHVPTTANVAAQRDVAFAALPPQNTQLPAPSTFRRDEEARKAAQARHKGAAKRQRARKRKS